jgi:hypothetical protein
LTDINVVDQLAKLVTLPPKITYTVESVYGLDAQQ